MSKVFLFHKDHAPDGQAFPVDALPSPDAGWVDTPAKFDPNYVDPPQVGAEPGTIPESARRRGYVPQPYPSTRFSHETGEEAKVYNAEQDQLLDPAIWKHVPKPEAESAPVAPALRAPEPPKGAPVASLSEDDKKAADAFNAKAAELHQTPIDTVVAKIKDIQDPAVLESIKQMEALNTPEPRMDVVKAVNKQIKAIAK